MAGAFVGSAKCVHSVRPRLSPAKLFRLPGMAAHAAVIRGVRALRPADAFGASDGDSFFRLFLAVQRLAILTTL